MDGMDDLETPSGETGGAEHLTHSQIRERAQTYDPELMADHVSEEDFNKEPVWRREKMVRLASRANENKDRANRAEGAVEQMRRELADLKASIQTNQAKAAEPEPQGWDAVKTPKLEEYVTRAEQTLHAAVLNPDNEDIKKQAQSIDPAMLAQARRELAKRDAGASVAEREKSWQADKAKEQAAAQLHGYLRNKYGDDVLNPKSELMRAAVSEYEQMADVGRIFGDAARIDRAIEVAHKRLHNTGRAIRDDERARLQIEGGVRREASPFNEIDALRAKGDWKSKGQAVEKSLDLALGQIFGNE